MCFGLGARVTVNHPEREDPFLCCGVPIECEQKQQQQPLPNQKQQSTAAPNKPKKTKDTTRGNYTSCSQFFQKEGSTIVQIYICLSALLIKPCVYRLHCQ